MKYNISLLVDQFKEKGEQASNTTCILLGQFLFPSQQMHVPYLLENKGYTKGSLWGHVKVINLITNKIILTEGHSNRASRVPTDWERFRLVGLLPECYWCIEGHPHDCRVGIMFHNSHITMSHNPAQSLSLGLCGIVITTKTMHWTFAILVSPSGSWLVSHNVFYH